MADVATTKDSAPDGSLDPGREAFIGAWRQFFGAVRRARGRSAMLTDGELTLSQLHVLTALGERDELRVGEIATAAGIAPPTVTRMLDGLERDGIVDRRHLTEDRRCVVAELTPRGRDLLERKSKLVGEKLGAVYESLDPGDRAQAERLLINLAAALEEL